jgi:Ser/Thr protein kinase RdoA (MazF antagonist)
MLVEPDLDHRVLAAALDRHYGLAARTLRFVPAGETAWCYRVTDESGGRWFLKLTGPGAIEPARAELALALADALAGLGLPVPRLRPTRSRRRWCRLAGLRAAVFDLVDGEPLDDRALADPGMAGRVARLVAAIHAATPAPAPSAGWPPRRGRWSGPAAGSCSPCWNGSRPWVRPPAPAPTTGCCATAT